MRVFFDHAYCVEFRSLENEYSLLWSTLNFLKTIKRKTRCISGIRTLFFTVKYFNHRQRNDILRNKTTRKYNIVEKETGRSRNVLLKSLKMGKQWAILPREYSKIAWYFLARGTTIVVEVTGKQRCGKH